MINENQPTRVVRYTTEHAPTIARFHADPSFVRGIRGPVGSGKSTACCMEILTRSQEQTPAPDGIRYTRWAVIRNSYPELKTTTLKTWGDWCPSVYGSLTMSSPIRHHVKTTTFDMEVLFLALDRPEDQRKLLSLELTGAWINEAREIPKAILDALTGRVGRYPSVSNGGCSWSGIILDTNPPDDQHWWYKFAEQETPEGYKFFAQPAGDSKEAENIPNLPKDYYKRIAAGKDPDWIKVYVKGEYGYVTEGKPVYPMYKDRTHCSEVEIEPVKGIPLLLGVDFGLTPAAVIGQKLVDGRWLILDEFATDEPGVVRFAENLQKYLASVYGVGNDPKLGTIGFDIGGGWGDPAGTTRDQKTDTAFDIMNEYFPLDKWQTKWGPAPDNDIPIRLESVRNALNRLVDGNPGFLLSPKCKVLRKGFVGGYHYPFLKSGSSDETHDKPKKNKFSHPHDALQYLLLGGGEHHVVLRKVDRSKRRKDVVIVKDVDYDIFN